MKSTDNLVWFAEIDKDDVALVGGKGANLGEMVKAKFPVPDGFIVTAKAYYRFVKENNLSTKILHLLNTANFNKPESLMQVSSHIKKEIMHAKIPEDIVKEIYFAYEKLGGLLSDALVAVRSSATAEDLPTASFAGQQETFLNVSGESNLILKIKEAWASLFNARAIFYRHQQHFNHFKVGIAIPVQKMVNSTTSGVMFTIDPVTNNKSTIAIEAIYGLGELIVQGEVTPDHYEVDKSTLEISLKKIENQTIMLKKVGTKTNIVQINKRTGEKQKISDHQIKELATLGKKLERHYYFPQDVEWAIEKNKIYLVQTRPITTIKSQKDVDLQQKKSQEFKIFLPNGKAGKLDSSQDFARSEILVKGAPASPGIATGPAKVIKSPKEIDKIEKGDVLVAPQTNPDFVPAMKKAVAIVTDKGGRTSHAAIVSRELGVPAVVGTGKATSLIKSGLIITVNGITGEVFKGGAVSGIKSEILKHDYIKTATKVYVNLAEPEFAPEIAKRHVDGVGLLRAEFMVAGIGTHPKKMIADGKSHVFVEKLAEQLCIFAKAFNPRPVVYRGSDFKTNEYRELVGGKAYEPVEPNPMLGYRGAFRYIHDPKVFELELKAIKIVRNKMGYKNLWLMIPFVRTVRELIDVKRIIATAGLYRSSSFKLWMMVEIPSNVILLEKFIEAGIDGVSIGSNDLAMLLLGTDRDNSDVASQFDERNESVLWALEKVIRTSNAAKITSSICGQAPSQYPDLVEKLIEWGITSVSVSPDSIYSVREHIAIIEKNLLRKR